MAIDIQLEYLIDSPGRAANTIGIGETLTLAAVSTTPGKEIWRWSPVGNIHADHFSWNGNRAKLIALSLFEHTVELEVKNQFTNETQRIEIHVAAPGRWQLGRPTQVTHQMGRYLTAAGENCAVEILYRQEATGATESIEVVTSSHADPFPIRFLEFVAPLRFHNAGRANFDNLELREGNATAAGTGPFAGFAGVNHPPTFRLQDAWIRIETAKQPTRDPDYIEFAQDTVSTGQVVLRHDTPGEFSWAIPWSYRLSMPAYQLVDINGAPIPAPDPALRMALTTVEHTIIWQNNILTLSKGGQTFICRRQ